ncbi:synaptotagmin-10-like isoform X2 [Tachypleus tridentatus]
MMYFSYQRVKARFQSMESSRGGCSSLLRRASSSPADSVLSLNISHSLPDIKKEFRKETFRPIIKRDSPARQATLPIVPSRHQKFQRQLSNHLEFNIVPFEICHKQTREKSPVGKIQPALYQTEEVTCTNSKETLGTPCGKLLFTLKYDRDVEGLIVRILKARDLPVKDIWTISNPYLKVFLFPDRQNKFQTMVHMKNLNPDFNETYVFVVTREFLKTQTLQFIVYDFNRFSRHDLIGQVQVRGLDEICDITHEVEYTMDILCFPQEVKDLGEIMLALCYLPTAGRLTITVVKARTLKPVDITGTSDPYVKVCLMCQGKRIKKKKTSVKKGTLNPVYNEALVFDVPAENIEDVNLLVKVLDYDRVGISEVMGCCGLGSGCIGLGRDHWLEMIDNPRKPVAQWHPLAENLQDFQEFKQPSAVKCINIG